MTTKYPDAALLMALADADRADGIVRVVVGAVISRTDGRVLLLRRTPSDFMGGLWELPSGKVDSADESMLDALAREVYEETGLKISDADGYLGAFDYLSGSGLPTRQHTFTAPVDADSAVTLSDEHDLASWLEPQSAEKRVSDAVRDLLIAWRNGVALAADR
jgi:8-oxo-dGTP diphosphatase